MQKLNWIGVLGNNNLAERLQQEIWQWLLKVQLTEKTDIVMIFMFDLLMCFMIDHAMVPTCWEVALTWGMLSDQSGACISVSLHWWWRAAGVHVGSCRWMGRQERMKCLQLYLLHLLLLQATDYMFGQVCFCILLSNARTGLFKTVDWFVELLLRVVENCRKM